MAADSGRGGPGGGRPRAQRRGGRAGRRVPRRAGVGAGNLGVLGRGCSSAPCRRVVASPQRRHRKKKERRKPSSSASPLFPPGTGGCGQGGTRGVGPGAAPGRARGSPRASRARLSLVAAPAGRRPSEVLALPSGRAARTAYHVRLAPRARRRLFAAFGARFRPAVLCEADAELREPQGRRRAVSAPGGAEIRWAEVPRSAADGAVGVGMKRKSRRVTKPLPSAGVSVVIFDGCVWDGAVESLRAVQRAHVRTQRHF